MNISDLVMVHGLKYSGKSEVAKHLVNEFGYTLYKFATPLKNMVRSLMRDAGVSEDMIEAHMEGDLKEAPINELGGVSARRLFETLGVEWRDMISSRLFADIGAVKVRSLLASGHRVVIDDLRFPHELDAMRELNPALWQVTRSREESSLPCHRSEVPMESSLFHVSIANQSSLENLKRTIDDQVRMLGCKNDTKFVMKSI